MSSTENLLVEMVRQIQSHEDNRRTDAELLTSYAEHHDEEAFAALVHRYGGLVLGTARRQLKNPHQAEDVFQATFLALARSASSLQQIRSLPGWLFIVAQRQARKAQYLEDRRLIEESACSRPTIDERDPLEEMSGRELIRLINEEIDRLPRDYQLPLLLCCVEGLSREETAQRLGWSEGAVKGKLECGRRQLADRLARRGITVSATLLASVAEGTVPRDLLARATAMARSPWSTSLPRTVVNLVTKDPGRAGWLGAVLVSLLAGLAIWGMSTGAKPEKSPKKAKPASAETVEILGKVVDEKGKPIVGARVKASGSQQTVRTEAEGRFRLQLPVSVAQALALHAEHLKGTLQGYPAFPYAMKPAARQTVTLTLRPARKIKVITVDSGKKPVADAWVSVVAGDGRFESESTTNAAGNAEVLLPVDAPIMCTVAGKAGAGLDYVHYRHANTDKSNLKLLPANHSDPVELILGGARTVRVKLTDEQGRPMPGIVVYPAILVKPNKPYSLTLANSSPARKVTDAKGLVTFDEVPDDLVGRLTFEIEAPDNFIPEPVVFDPRSGRTDLAAMLLPLVPVQGRVTFADGKPAVGIPVQVVGSGHSRRGFHGGVITDAKGVFKLRVYPDQYYMFVAGDKKWASAVTNMIIRRKAPKAKIDLVVQPSTRVYGQVTQGPDKTPVANRVIAINLKSGKSYYELPEDQRLPNPLSSTSAISPLLVHTHNTDKQGRFEFFVGPGNYVLWGPRSRKPVQFEIKNQKSHEVNFHSELPDVGSLSGRVVLKKSPKKSVPKATVTGTPINSSMRRFNIQSKPDGTFSTERGLCEMLVHARSNDGKLAGIVKIQATDKHVDVPVEPTTTAKGRLIDQATGKPVPKAQIDYGVRVTYASGGYNLQFGGKAITDANGEYTLTGLVPGWEYELWLVQEFNADGHPESCGTVHKLTPKDPKPIKIDVIQHRPSPPRTLQGRIEAYFKKPGSLEERLTHARDKAKHSLQRVLLIFGSPKSTHVKQFFALRENRKVEVRRSLASFALLPINVTNPKLKAAGMNLARQSGVEWPGDNELSLVIFDQEKLLAKTSDKELLDGSKLSATKLIAFLEKHTPELPDARQLLNDALTKAKKENKAVLVQVSGANCPPCVLLSKYLKKHHDLIAKDYVYLKVDSRFKHGREVIDKVHNGKEHSVPWTVILDASGKPLINSEGPKGNIGFPGDRTGREHFEKMLRTTSLRLSEDEIRTLLQGLE